MSEEKDLQTNDSQVNSETEIQDLPKTEETVVSETTTEKSENTAENSETESAEAENLENEQELKLQMRRYSRRNFLALGLGAIGAVAGWEYIKSRPDAGGIPSSLRKAHEFNEAVTQAFYSPQRLAPTFAVSEAQMPRVNGNYGVDAEDFDPAKWRLQVVGAFNPKQYSQYVDDVYYDYEPDAPADEADEESDETDSSDDSTNSDDSSAADETTDETPEPDIPGLLLTLADIKSLPRYEMVTELKCIEGWSVKVYWAGARLADFIEKFAPQTRDGAAPDVKNKPQNLVQYVSLQTPDEEYYVGIDLPSAMHPQTLLCYEMNGAPLPLEHGAPLRLVTPLKYGIKHIKRIGRITFTDERPKDYWAERGYDWYSGH